MQISSKEHLVYFMQTGVMRLSNYDLKFVQNLHYAIIQLKPITSNQVSLLEKLILKYHKQFTKQKLNTEFLQKLPWTIKIIQSDPAFTDAYISIENSKVIFKAPFNKNFIQNLRQLNYNPYTWIPQSKRYEANLSTMALKVIVKIANKFYPIVHYCSELTELLNSLEKYKDVKYWEPTLVKVKENYIISCINQPLDDAIKHVPLDDKISTLSILKDFGINISETILNDKNKLNFINNFIVDIENGEYDNMISYLSELNCDAIYFSGQSLLIKTELKNKLNNVTLNQFNMSDMPYNKKLHNFNYPIAIQFSSTIATSKVELCGIKKIIRVKNLNPIHIK